MNRRDILELGTGALAGSALTKAVTSSGDTAEPSSTDTTAQSTTTEQSATTDSATDTTADTTQTDPDCDSRFHCDTYRTATRTARAVREAVVVIQATYTESSFTIGTGWLLDDHHVVTNHHVIDGAQDLTLWAIDGTEYSPTVVGSSPDPDVALLRVEGDTPPALEPGDSTQLEPDTPVIQIAHPSDAGFWMLSLGRLIARDEYVERHPELKTDVPGGQGSSGAPLVTLDGTVVGLTYGQTTHVTRDPGEPPQPTSDEVYEALPENVTSLHIPIETVLETIDGWR